VRFVGQHLGWCVGILIAVLVGPAIAKQWSDRNQELSLKRDLVANVSSSVAASVTRGEEIARQGGSARDRQNALDAWVQNQSTLTGSFIVYFPDGPVHQMWSNAVKKPTGANWLGFRDAVYDYVELSCCGPHANRDVADIAQLLRKFGITFSQHDLTVLAARNKESRTQFDDSFHRVGLKLFALRNKFLGQLVQAHAQGFSRGWRDFGHNVVHPVG
jgi:hypothetical protein